MYEIKGSKSRSVREKNVLYSNLKNAILKGKSLKMRQKKDPKNLTKNARPLRPLRPARKKDKKSMILKGFSEKKWFGEKIAKNAICKGFYAKK